jgi:hypothetical protein
MSVRCPPPSRSHTCTRELWIEICSSIFDTVYWAATRISRGHVDGYAYPTGMAHEQPLFNYTARGFDDNKVYLKSLKQCTHLDLCFDLRIFGNAYQFFTIDEKTSRGRRPIPVCTLGTCDGTSQPTRRDDLVLPGTRFSDMTV